MRHLPSQNIVRPCTNQYRASEERGEREDLEASGRIRVRAEESERRDGGAARRRNEAGVVGLVGAVDAGATTSIAENEPIWALASHVALASGRERTGRADALVVLEVNGAQVGVLLARTEDGEEVAVRALMGVRGGRGGESNVRTVGLLMQTSKPLPEICPELQGEHEWPGRALEPLMGQGVQRADSRSDSNPGGHVLQLVECHAVPTARRWRRNALS